MKIYAYYPQEGKEMVVGDVIDTDFVKDVKSKNFMRVVQGYGIQEEGFAKIPKEVKRIILLEKDTDKTYVSNFTDWILHGKVADYGHGKQRFLSIKYMEKQ